MGDIFLHEVGKNAMLKRWWCYFHPWGPVVTKQGTVNGAEAKNRKRA